MLAHIKTQVENPGMPESGFSRDKIMHLCINFHRLLLTRGSSYTELPKWQNNKKAVINPQEKMKSALNGLSLKHYITKILSIILRELACRGLMKINISGKDFSF